MSAQTASNLQMSAEISNSGKKYTSWKPPESFSMAKEEPIFLVNSDIGHQKQTPQPFSLEPRNVEESLSLSAWDMEDTSEEIFTDNKNSILNRATTHNYTSTHSRRVNNYDDDTASVASATTVSTTTTATTSTSDFPSVVHVTLADLIKMQERRQSMQNNINNYNRTIGTTSINNKGKQKLVNFKDEIIESSEGSLRKPVKVSPSSIISNDSSTVKDNNSSHQGEISDISITPSLGLTRVSKEEFEAAKLDKQNSLRAWVKCIWPLPRLPNAKQLTSGLSANSLLKRNLHPLTIGIIITVQKSAMIQTAIIRGTKHISNGIGKNGQIKFVGKPDLIKSICDPREYLLLHCPTYHNPPYHNGDPRIAWTENFLLNKVLPRLANEASRIQCEAGLYLTVKETLLRGLGNYSLYHCKFCPDHHNRMFTYDKICEHLTFRHSVKQVYEEEMIKINLREYITVFYKNNLPPKIVPEL
ncbi:hypothetical protein RclHR1_06170016 [Rhizophagus clarus]|uniref:Uncharacterized protein n=1 Tax=Rhizophagus clarus TaxID=94130 RepID=A0A2Z6S8Y9_9GLOM|nr:hypothetical protein RclHR1_06170016 [Rhizophagus clarus]GES76672.1 hypothetical protein GLOIN_2v1563240 [Rhizophagus clarus]